MCTHTHISVSLFEYYLDSRIWQIESKTNKFKSESRKVKKKLCEVRFVDQWVGWTDLFGFKTLFMIHEHT